MNDSYNVYHFPNPVLQPGDYCVPFQLTLPQGIPASIYYKNDNIDKMPTGKIKYHLRVKLARYGTFTKDIRYKQILLVREPLQGFS